MNLLLDTHALLWAVSEPQRLAPRAAALIIDPGNSVYVSAVNTWEMVIKAGLGRLEAPFGELSRIFEATGFFELPVTIAHSLRVLELPALHRDPFDRLLVAQALEEGLTLVSRDSAVAAYGAPVVWD